MRFSTNISKCTNKKEEILRLNKTNNSYIHIDIMDDKVVSNTNFHNIEEIIELQKNNKRPLDIHLMMEEPLPYIKKLKRMNIEFITIPLEIEANIYSIINKVHKMGYKVGISIKPNTNIIQLKKYLNEIDMILLMNVEPEEQFSLNNTIDKISQLKKMIADYHCNILIAIDIKVDFNDGISQVLDNVDIIIIDSNFVKNDDLYKNISTENMTEEKQLNKLINKKNKYQTIIILIKLIYVLVLFIIFSYIITGMIDGTTGACVWDCQILYGFDALVGNISTIILIFAGFYPVIIPILLVLYLTKNFCTIQVREIEKIIISKTNNIN